MSRDWIPFRACVCVCVGGGGGEGGGGGGGGGKRVSLKIGIFSNFFLPSE